MTRLVLVWYLLARWFFIVRGRHPVIKPPTTNICVINTFEVQEQFSVKNRLELKKKKDQNERKNQKGGKS